MLTDCQRRFRKIKRVEFIRQMIPK